MHHTNKILTLVINLDRSPKRLAQISGQLNELGWSWERLSAADGNVIQMDDASLIDVDAFSKRHGKRPLPGEVGCYLSHVWAMRRFLETDKPYLLVMEDDLRIGPDLPKVLDALVGCPERWDVVMLSGIHSRGKLAVQRLITPYRLSVSLVRYAGASCYLLNRHAAAVYVRDLLPMKLPYDHEYDRAWSYGLKCRAVTPAPCQHSFEDGSDLHPPGVARHNFHWTRRLGTYWWRLKTDLVRLFHSLGQWLRYRT